MSSYTDVAAYWNGIAAGCDPLSNADKIRLRMIGRWLGDGI